MTLGEIHMLPVPNRNNYHEMTGTIIITFYSALSRYIYIRHFLMKHIDPILIS